MPALYRSRKPLEPHRRNGRTIITFIASLALCLLVQPAEANDVGETTVSAWTRTYQFLADKSTIKQTGGIAGIHRIYTLTGTFRLAVDFEAGTAFFDIVDASADYSDYSIPAGRTGRPVRYSIDPNEVFNLTALAGTIVDGNSILFEGLTDDGSSVQITLTLSDGGISLKGETVPPPDSADFFIYTLDALAEPKYEYGGGSGTADDPYRIYTAEQMNAIGANLIDWNNHFKLMADIDIAEFDGKDGRPAFNIIGTRLDSSFTGAFDGNDHKILNFKCIGLDNAGLFGIVNDPNAEIKNLGLINPRVVDWTAQYIGSVVGRLEHGNLTNCYAQGGSAEEADFVGGLVGSNWNGKIANCHSNGTISGRNTMYVGGLVGENFGTIINCYSTGIVHGHTHVGGLVGINGGTIINSYSTSDVTGTYDVGGLVGSTGGNIATCYGTGSVSGYKRVGGLVGSNNGSIAISYSSGLVRGNENVGGLVGDNSGSTVASFWDIETSGQANSAGGIGITTSEMQITSTFIDAGWDFVDEVLNGTCDYWQISSGEYPQLRCHASDKPVMPDGLGTSDQPYLIRDARDLGTVGFEPMAHYRLETSVDLSEITWSMAVIPWFVGAFDGNGYIISNLHIKGAGYLGLFGRLGSIAKVSNLGLEAVDVNGTGSYVGGLVGYNSASINKSYSSGIVTGEDYVGGFVGHNSGFITTSYSSGTVNGSSEYVGGFVGHNSAIITTNYSTCTVSGDDYVGGLAGYNFGSISTSYSIGKVSGDYHVGGLVGTNFDGNITTSYSTGAVSGIGNSIGGLVGYNWYGSLVTQCYSPSAVSGVSGVGGLVGTNNEGTVTQCYSTGAVSGSSSIGGLVGYNNSGTVTHCYSTGAPSGNSRIGGLVGYNYSGTVTSGFWDIQTSGRSTSTLGTGKTTAEMQTASTFLEAGWDFVDEAANGTEDIWWILEGQDYPRLWWEAAEQ